MSASLASSSKTGWRMLARLASPSKPGLRMSASLASTCQAFWWMLAQERLFYAQITYFICIKRSSLHSLNLPNSQNSPNSPNSRKTCLSRVWRVLSKWFGECRRVWWVRANQIGKCRRIYRVRPIFKKGHFGEYSNLPKLANFRRVLEFDKFAVEWPLLNLNLNILIAKEAFQMR